MRNDDLFECFMRLTTKIIIIIIIIIIGLFIRNIANRLKIYGSNLFLVRYIHLKNKKKIKQSYK